MALIECYECGKEVSSRAAQCIGCGAPLGHALQDWDEDRDKQSAQHAQDDSRGYGEHVIVRPARNRGIYILLGLFFLGLLGAHNFYAGRYGPAVAQLLITCILGWFVIGLIITVIWVLIDLAVVTHDGNGVEMT